ncbi:MULTISPECIES: cation:proton antiporter [Aeromonas]|uniref:Cation:proton antiporter n=1 Tax=Aeromonas veronii TaxID=654 RepID=A0AAW5MBP7_AERVE|nr:MULTISPECIES: cation:proton antiporter [Aeromonas]MCR6552662.1 cation:proton antiporter [Aeromonas sp. CPF2-S1]HDN9001247.1 cation:proton antiporter [Aeromonas veronii AMC24]AEB50748.1 Na+/H+ antiporter [Aeromonas veronii B565]ELC7279187.1 cation:proton antiporter [Aeromonas veronii]MBS4690705.1 cation:proton antiporter [Aeromonas veronii bv. veronii]
MDAHLLYQNLAVIAAFLLIYSLIAGRFESKLVNGPLLFLLTGWLLGPGGLELLSLSIDSAGIKLLAELTLVIVLFNDAANTNWQVLLANRQLPIRLLLIGLPLTLLCGALFGHWIFPDLPLLEMAILSTILAPTDAALGKAVVSNPAVPAPVREGLNQESGLNDGICVPVLLLLLALIAPTEQHAGTATLAITLMLEEIGIGLLVAFVLTSLTIRLLKISYLNGWQLPLWRQLTMPGLALLCFALAQTLGGSGFIAAFVGGLFIGHRLGEHKHAYMDSCEGYGDLLSVVIWMVFGATLMPILPELLHWQYWLYAIASLTLLRMVPVWLSLIGTGLKPELKLFIGWFGPRGLASIVFAVMVLQNEPSLIGQRPIIATVLCTIILSVILHGLTANPWVERFKPR